ncbi:MAG: hypothetical protein CVT64_00885 [Actinobacteria bacterium HGW-Actinobacteria-4]|nr:MAG: hypothetical protein CVT64_00885 [Actinobacteria bacterium HGW-Actinobacteria-4]
MLDYGDHGLGAARRDPNRVGFIELTDALRWVPQAGDGWEVPIATITVKTPKTWLNRPSKGVEIEVPEMGPVRIRGMVLAPGTVAPPSTGVAGQARRSGRILVELLARGAKDGSASP